MSQDSRSPSRSRSGSVSPASSRPSVNGLDADDKGSVNGHQSPVHSDVRSEARSDVQSEAHSDERRSVHSNASGKRFSSRSASRSSGSVRRRRIYSQSRSRSRSSRRYRSHSRDRRESGREGYRGSRRSRSRSPMSNRRRHFGDRENPTPSRCIGVFGLSLHTRERDLHDIFSRYGEVENIQMVYDNYSGRSRGFCFVYFRYAEDAREAKERGHGIEIDGRNIRCDYSITDRAHSPTPGVYLGRTSRRKQSPYHHRSYRRSPSPRYSRSYRRSRSRSHSYDRYDPG